MPSAISESDSMNNAKAYLEHSKDDGISIEQKIIEIMDARNIFIEQYLSAKEQFDALFLQQSELIAAGNQMVDDSISPDLKDGNVYEKITINNKDNIRKLIATIKIILKTDPLILNSTKNLNSCDDHLFQHSINVCHVGTIVLKLFNDLFSNNINRMLNKRFYGEFKENQCYQESFRYYQQEAIDTISIGYLIHDLGKVLLPQSLLNKKRDLTSDEFNELKKHSFEYGKKLLHINNVRNVYIENIVQYHHAPIYENEQKSYPNDKSPYEIPPYVKICKLADIYSAMTSKRSYGNAINPIRAVNTIFRNYSGKDPMLQFILYAFMKEIGIYPVGSVLTLKNRQMAYVINNIGPEVIIFNDSSNADNTIKTPDRVINLSHKKHRNITLLIDSELLPRTPDEVFDKMPGYLKEFHKLLEET